MNKSNKNTQKKYSSHSLVQALTKVNVPSKFVLAQGEQPGIAIIFRGTGKNIREDEKLVWHPDVDIY